jgi:flagellar hook-associated protein 1 FlgK
MASLFGTMSISLRALLAQQAGLQTTSDNIANVNTDGYCRKRVVLAEDTTFLDGGGAAGSGVHVADVESLRDRVLELRISDETQQQGALSGFVGAMSQVESLFSNVDGGIGAQIDAFFNSITRLSADPSDVSQRQNVLIASGNLANAFRATAQNLIGSEKTLDTGIDQGVAEVNQLVGSIASLNTEVTRLEKLGGDTSTFEDQRTQLIRQLSQQIDVSVIQGDDGLTLTTGNGAPLVVGSKPFDLHTVLNSNGRRSILSGETDITSQISGGNIGGLLRARDEGIASVLDDLNALASGLATSLNNANSNGRDLDGAVGGNIFAVPTTLNAASNFSVIMTDPRKLAASSDGTAGNNANLASFTAVGTDPCVAGQNPLEFYSGIVSRIGNDVATAKADGDATDLVLSQLDNQRGAVSGVSLDEEAANLVRFQRAFEASAKVVSVVDEMLQTLLAMGQS